MSEKRKVGRPKIENKKSKDIHVKVDQKTFEQLNTDTMKRIWEFENVDTLSAFIRMLLLRELRKAGLR